MANSKRSAAAFVAGIGRCRRVSSGQTGHHCPRIDVPRPTTVVDRQKFAVPIFRRHPQLHFNMRVGRWLKNSCNAAMCRQYHALAAAAIASRTRRDGFRRVIVVFGMDIDFNASHGPCWTAAAINKIPSVIIWTLLLKANGFRQVPRWFALPRFQSQW